MRRPGPEAGRGRGVDQLIFSLPGIRYITAAVAIVLCIVTGAQSGGLGDILQQVEKNTPTLKAAHARTAMQQAAVSQEKSSYWGEVDAVAKNSNYDDDRLINPISYPVSMQPELFDDNQIGYGISGRIPLDINGRITAKVRAADSELEAALAGEDNVRLLVLHNAADLYHSLEGVKALEKALEKQIEALQTHIQVAVVSIAAGRVAPVEKLRFVADLEAAKGKLAGLRGQELGIRARLAALMGTESFVDPVQPVPGPPAEAADINEDISTRPDIRALKSSRDAADAEVDAAFARRLPDLNVNGSWLQNQGFDGDGDNTWALFVQLQVPLWDGGGRRAAVSRAKAGRAAVRHELDVTRNQARAEFVAAKADLAAAESSYRATEASVAAALETARIQTDRFAEGRISATDLVDAEAALTAARSDSALALTRWWQAGDHLRRAVGIEPLAYDSAETTYEDTP